jgi:hypothetical protein
MEVSMKVTRQKPIEHGTRIKTRVRSYGGYYGEGTVLRQEKTTVYFTPDGSDVEDHMGRGDVIVRNPLLSHAENP